jgi:hypothetical protein
MTLSNSDREKLLAFCRDISWFMEGRMPERVKKLTGLHGLNRDECWTWLATTYDQTHGTDMAEKLKHTA